MTVLKIIGPTVLTFIIGILITPVFTKYFYKYKMWKKSPRTLADTSDAFNDVHNTEFEVSTPRVGGSIIWTSIFLTVFLIYFISLLEPNGFFAQMNFFSRSQTVVPLGAFFLGAFIGLLDDLLQIAGKSSYARDSLIYRRVKIFFVTLIAVTISLWFYFKLEVASVHVPFVGDVFLGWVFIPFFVLTMLAIFSTSVIDGIDGLSGGVLATIFSAYAVIAFIHNQMDMAALCGALAGAILAFLWFNIPPARFYMGETGMLALTVVLSVIAFSTNAVLEGLVIAFPLIITSLSVVIQILGFKLLNKKRIFRVAPLHHHFQALGWPREKVVMRYWVVSVVFAVLGVIIALVG